jgi:hypothetical protein
MLKWGRSRYIGLSLENIAYIRGLTTTGWTPWPLVRERTIPTDNGMRLMNVAPSRNMVVGSTMFEHKDIHKTSWKSPDGNVFNQTDHILIDGRCCSDLLAVRSYRGPILTLITI